MRKSGEERANRKEDQRPPHDVPGDQPSAEPAPLRGSTPHRMIIAPIRGANRSLSVGHVMDAGVDS
jgi:hypothetical protein